MPCPFRKLVLTTAALALAGCVFVPREQDMPADAASLPEGTADPVPPPTERARATEAASVPARPVMPPPPPPPPAPARVLVLLPSGGGGFEPVVAELVAQLMSRGFEPERVETLARPLLPAEAGTAQALLCVVALGSEATRLAVEHLPLPVVFGLVADLDFPTAGAHGVATLPPAALQLAAWKEVDPTLQRVALILSRDEHALAAEARQAAEAAGVDLALGQASSDQEALYRFRRMAGTVDGLWLLPDNSIMSPRTIRDMLELANARGVQSLAFTPALLDWGATIGVSGTPRDIAAKLVALVERIRADDTDDLPLVTPLSELEITLNADTVGRLGLTLPAGSRIVGDDDT